MFCSAVSCKFSVYGMILSIYTFDTEGGFIALWNFVFFQSRHFLGFLRFSCLRLMFAETSQLRLSNCSLSRTCSFGSSRNLSSPTRRAKRGSAREVN